MSSSSGQQETSYLIASGIPLPSAFPSPATQQARFDYFNKTSAVSNSSWAHFSNQLSSGASPATTNSTIINHNSNHPNIIDSDTHKKGNMTSSHSHTFQSAPSMAVAEQPFFPNYSHQQLMTSSFYSSFPLVPNNQAQMRMEQQQQQHHHHQHQRHPQPLSQHHHQQAQQAQQPQQQHAQQAQHYPQQQGPSSLLQPVPQQMSRQESEEYDFDFDGEDDEEEEDTSEVMIPNDSIETRLKVAQAAQDAAASEGPNGVFACPYCDKRYAGKHARSIWRRHLQDKHAIPLSQQPRRTRWDGDANRPKNAEERRQRMLESKRRWARKKRQSEKAGFKGNGDDCFGEASPTESSISIFQEQEQQPQSFAVQAHTSKKRSVKPKGPQQLKFHNITQSEIPPFVDFGSSTGSGHSSGGGGMLWPTAGNGALQSHTTKINRNKSSAGSTLSSAHNFNTMSSRNSGGMGHSQQQNTFAMMTSIKSPRKALGTLDSNASRMVRPGNQSSGGVDEFQHEMMMNKPSLNSSISPALNATTDIHKMTPMNRYSQIYPTPPSAGDAKMDSDGVMQDAKMNAKLISSYEKKAMPLLSPPSSHHTGESSPSYLGATTINLASVDKRNSTTVAFTPLTAVSGQRSPANNPFSLECHKISPITTVRRSALPDAALQQPLHSSDRLNSAVEGSEEHKLSPIQVRKRSDAASPSEKDRKLPPLVTTPLRSFKVKDEPPTPKTTFGLSNAMGSVSIRRVRPSGVDAWKALATPGADHADRSVSFGFTPLHVQSSKYSTTRGFGSISRPSRGGGGGGGDNGDQFSSPQHPSLSQSLGLAPHSTGKGLLGGFGVGSATPYIGHYSASNSPWPDSVLRPTFKTSSSKRGRDEGSFKGEESGRDGEGDEEEEEEEEEDNGGMFLHETPSRPAKYRRPSTLLGSENSNGTLRSRISSSGTKEQQPPSYTTMMKPISFNLSSDREERKESKQDSSLDSEATGGKSSLVSSSTSPTASEDNDSEAIQSPTIKKRALS
ncbi:hypothetical protein CBS101457_002649 [Exobasidium rhododendri]|nr:hypothetical protein CBS101457_002649 [Exobasidium rhododendri]